MKVVNFSENDVESEYESSNDDIRTRESYEEINGVG